MSQARQSNPPAAERGRWSSRRKTEVVLRVLRGEDLDALSRELGVTAATLAHWRDQFLAGGQAAVRSRPADERDEEIARLRSKVGELTMENELLRDRARRAEAGAPFGQRRSRP
jgi:transposase-like protein